jgi:hypothetical protein
MVSLLLPINDYNRPNISKVTHPVLPLTHDQHRVPLIVFLLAHSTTQPTGAGQHQVFARLPWDCLMREEGG